ncbi:hypothetical protein FMN50_11340 [Rhodobacterales bacterium]|nr:hypothetical protein FMN50_11340 [Rhodobacterales bacterium]
MSYKDIPPSSQIIRRIQSLEPQNDEPDRSPQALVELVLSIVYRYKFLLVGCMLAGFVLAAYYASTLPPVYKATASVLLEPRRLVSIDGQSSFQRDLNLNRVDSELVVIRSERLLSEVFDSLQLQDNPDLAPSEPGTMSRLIGGAKALVTGTIGTLLGKPADDAAASSEAMTDRAAKRDRLSAFNRFANRVSVSRVGQSFVISVTYASSDAELAARVANATISAYLLQTVEAEFETLRSGTGTLQGRLDVLSQQMDTSRAAMQAGRVPDVPIPDANARVIGEAQVPLGASEPRKTLIAAFGATFGLILGIVFATLGFILNKKIWNVKDLRHKFSVSCLAEIPLPRALRRRSNGGTDAVRTLLYRKPDGKFTSALRDLRTTIDMICAPFADKRNSVVALVSWNDSANVAHIGEGLAVLSHQSGHRLTLLNENRRKGASSEGSDNRAITFADAIVDPETLDDSVLTEAPSLLVLPVHSQKTEVNLRADFSSQRAKDLIARLIGRGKILMALPPLGESADGLSLAVHADAVLIVITAGKTTTDNVKDAERQLRRIGANLVGTVLVDS